MSPIFSGYFCALSCALAVIVAEIVNSHGVEMLAPIVVVAGAIQIVAGRLALGAWFRAVAPAVIYAMLAGIGVLISLPSST